MKLVFFALTMCVFLTAGTASAKSCQTDLSGNWEGQCVNLPGGTAKLELRQFGCDQVAAISTYWMGTSLLGMRALEIQVGTHERMIRKTPQEVTTDIRRNLSKWSPNGKSLRVREVVYVNGQHVATGDARFSLQGANTLKMSVQDEAGFGSCTFARMN